MPITLCALELCTLLASAFLLFGRIPRGRSGRGLAALRLLTAELGLAGISMLIWIIGAATGLIRYDNMRLTRVMLVICLVRLLLVGGLMTVLAAAGIRQPLAGWSRRELAFLSLGEVPLLTMLTSVILVSFGREGEARLGPVLLIFTLGSLALTVICCLLVRAVYRRRFTEVQRREALRLLSAQERYYTMLLAKENETRAFRHDIRSHLACMRSLCIDGEYEKLKSYLDSLDGLLPDSGRTVFSGNSLVDIIISDLQTRFPEVEVKIFGSLGLDHTLADMDICTIFSNLLTNAFEAADKCEEKTVALHLKALGANLLITVVNSARDTAASLAPLPASTKTEPGHGYGLSNVRACLAPLNGDLTLKQEGGVFEASVMIPNVITSPDDR